MSLKVAYNDDYGGFNLSDTAIIRFMEIYEKRNGTMVGCPTESEIRTGYNIKRHDPVLIETLESLTPAEYNGFGADIKIEEVEGKIYRIHHCDGAELVEVPHDNDWIVVV